MMVTVLALCNHASLSLEVLQSPRTSRNALGLVAGTGGGPCVLCHLVPPKKGVVAQKNPLRINAVPPVPPVPPVFVDTGTQKSPRTSRNALGLVVPGGWRAAMPP
jgi:hypothetical protein